MSFTGLKERIKTLEEKGLLTNQTLPFGKNMASKKYYHVSALGKEFLDLYFRMQEFYGKPILHDTKMVL
jgi:DNA-binding PadR family transcriptional regulator